MPRTSSTTHGFQGKVMKPLHSMVVGYVRVSTIDQSTEGVSLSAQRAQISAYCKMHRLHLEKIYCDEGLSAKNITGRPAVTEVLDLIRQRKVDGVVVTKLDRIVRSTRDAIDLADLCRQKQVGLHSIHERLDTTTPMGSFFYTLLAALGEMERKLIGDRTKTALSHLRAQGQKTGGFTPFGYRCISRRSGGRIVRKLVPVPEEQSVIRLVRRLRRSGRTLRSIAADLTRRGIKTKRGGSKWHPEGVNSLLRSVA
jgi:site-specific DNA recombinase